MNNLIESIIFAVMGVAILGAAIITSASVEVIGLGAAITVAAVACIVAALCNKK